MTCLLEILPRFLLMSTTATSFILRRRRSAMFTFYPLSLWLERTQRLKEAPL